MPPGNYAKKVSENEKIRKIRKKSKLNGEKIWKIWKKSKLNSETIWKYRRKVS
jgi:hypothetical protein